MSDTLTDRDLLEQASDWVSPFRPGRIRSASYDVSAGDALIIARSPKEGGREHVNLRTEKRKSLRPGLMAILVSLEKINLPPDVQAKISLRSDFATRGLFFAGGLIDPGFGSRELWLPIANLSTTEVAIEYDQPMFRVEFTRLAKNVSKPYVVDKTDIGEDDMPNLPEDPVFDIREISRRLASVEAKAQLFEPSSMIVQGFLLAAMAGTVAGAVFAGVRTIKDGDAVVAAAIGAGVTLGSFVLIFLVSVLLRKK